MTIAVGFGLITCQMHPDRSESWSELVAESMQLAEAAESLELDSVWVSEHHFVDDGHLPSLLPMLAAFAARTKRITVGTGLLLAPLHDPVRLAEDAAVVDLISGGRLVLGLGLGWRDEEFEAFEIATNQRVRRLITFIETARAAWSGQQVSSGSARPRVTPRPTSAEGPPLWVGALVEPAVRRAGRIADGFMATEVTPDELAEQVGWIREEHASAGREGPFAFSLHLPTFCLPGGVTWSDAAEALRYPGWKYDDMAEDRGAAGPLRRPEIADGEELERLRATSLVGSPAEVADRVREYATATGGNLHFIGRSYLPSVGPDVRREALQGLAEVRKLLAD